MYCSHIMFDSMVIYYIISRNVNIGNEHILLFSVLKITHVPSFEIQMPHQGHINSSPLSDAYMRQWTVSTLVQIMACRLIGANPLSEPMLE